MKKLNIVVTCVLSFTIGSMVAMDDDHLDLSLSSFTGEQQRQLSNVLVLLYQQEDEIEQLKKQNESDRNNFFRFVKSLENCYEAPVHYFARNGDVEGLALLCEAGVNLNSKNMNNETALYSAVKKGEMNAAQMLLEYNADPNCQSRCGLQLNYHAFISHCLTPLHRALLDNNQSAVEMLLRYHATVDQKSMTIAFKRCEISMQELLLAADVDDDALVVVLHYYTREGNVDGVRFLLEHNVDIHEEAPWPLHIVSAFDMVQASGLFNWAGNDYEGTQENKQAIKWLFDDYETQKKCH